jgi:hypothetical protein
MEKMILVLSRCQNLRFNPKSRKYYYKFHFKGFYSGLKIKEIVMITKENISITKGNDYLLWVQQKKYTDGILEVQLFKYKKIE